MFIEPIIHTFSNAENKFANAMAENEMLLSRYISQHKKVVLVGPTGIGKSTIIRYIACLVASKGDISKYKFESESLPLIVSLYAFNNHNGSFIEFISSIYRYHTDNDGSFEHFLRQKLIEGKVILLLDGLNDLSKTKQEQLFSQINNIYCEYNSNNTIIITTRLFYNNRVLNDFFTGYIEELNIEQIEFYSSNVFSKVISNSLVVRENSLRFSNAILRNSEIYTLARNPLFLSILVLLFIEQKELPHNRIELFNIYLEDLVDIVKNKDVSHTFSKDSIIRILAYVSYNMIKNDSISSFVTESVLKGYIKNYLEHKMKYNDWDSLKLLQLFFDQVLNRLGVFVYDEKSHGYILGQYAIKEYLAALHICFDLEEYIDQRRRGRLRYQEVVDMFIQDNRWHEILKLVVEYILIVNPNICNPVDMVNSIIKKKILFSNIADAERSNIAGECLVFLHGFSNLDIRESNNLCKAQLIDVISNIQIPYKIRIRSARVLSYIGDPRLEDSSIVPEMIDVEAGSFIKGANKEEIEHFIAEVEKVDLTEEDLWIKNYWKEILLSEISVKEKVNIPHHFKIGKYPITNRQYQCFLNENPSYPIPNWGDDKKGAIYTWDKEKRTCNIAYNNCPVVLVSWNDATAYCKWLSQKTGRYFRLPTEAEWEYAARGPESRIYPWGNQWIDGYANTLESGLKDIIPIGCFLEGVSHFGLFDCSGQIWEWTSTQDNKLWKKAWPEGMRSSNDTEAYIVRGGAWDDISVFARCSSRGPNAASFYEHYIGFRIVEELL